MCFKGNILMISDSGGQMKKISKLVVAIEAVFIFLLVFILTFYDVLYSFDSLIRDRFYQTPREINNKIKIIAIDDETLHDIGQYGAWSRSVYADIINTLGDYPSVIALDIMIFEDMDEEGDEALKAACKKSGKVVAGSYINYNSVYKTDSDGKGYIDYFNVEQVEQPIIANECITGFVNSSPDNDGIVRSVLLEENESSDSKDKTVKSFAFETYSLYCKNTGIKENDVNLDNNGRMWISYAGRPGDYEHISLSKVLDGSVDPQIFKDCIVLVGAYANGLQDQFAVPNSSEQMYGVEIHANIIQGLLDGKTPMPVNRFLYALFVASFTVLAFLISRKLKIKITAPLVLLMIICYFAGGKLLDNVGMIIPVLYAPLFVFLVFLVNMSRKYVEEAVEKRRIYGAFKKYVAPQVVEEIAKTGGYQIKLGGENRHIAVLFVDIRGFTPMSESLEPEQVVDILNSYLNLTTNCIFSNGGTLDKFIGDATMAVFNAPFELDDYIFRAVKTAWNIVCGGNEIESKFLEKYGKSVSFGVGVNCGNAVVGNIGCDFRMDYTAIGDTVNTAARLEANAKRGQVLISQTVYDAVSDRVTVEPIGEIPLKGKSKGVFVYSLTGITGEIRKKENV